MMENMEEDIADVSVIIPLYNREKTIKYCLDSIAKQSLKPREVICVDDCSSDKSAVFIKEFKMAHKEIEVIYYKLEKNQGAQVARNFGIYKARGEWIAFLDSDDEWLEQTLEKMYEVIKDKEYKSFVFGDAIVENHIENTKTVWSFAQINNYKGILTNPGPMFQGMLTSKKILMEIGLLDEKVPSYQEWETSIRLIKNCNAYHINMPLFHYHLHEGETISKNKQRDLDGYKYVIYKHKKDIKEICGNKVWEGHIINQITRCIDFGLPSLANEYIDEIAKSSKMYSEILKVLWKIKLNNQVIFRCINKIRKICL